MSANAMVSDISSHIEFIGFAPDATRAPDTPGATIIGVSFTAPTGDFANKGANELVNLVLEENVKLRTGRANDTLEFFQAEVDRLSGELERQSDKITTFKTENFEALPDSLAERRNRQILEQERLIALQREESDLKNQRATVVWVFERTGRSATAGQLSPEEEQLDALQNQLVQQRTIYAATSPRIRMLENQLAALQKLVDDQREARSVPGPDGKAAPPTSELDVELAPIDARLKFIAEDKAAIQKTLDDLDKSIQATPANEQILTGLERELANTQNQYNAAVANTGQAQVGERIEVLSKGERFSLIEQPNLPGKPSSPNRKLIAAAGMLGGIGAGARADPPDGDAQPLDPPAGGADRPARHRAFRHAALHPHPRRGPAQADDRRRGAGADRGGDPGDPVRDPDLLDAARSALRHHPRQARAGVGGAGAGDLAPGDLTPVVPAP